MADKHHDPKPILKTASETAEKRRKSVDKPHIQFDEKVIQEHDKERGTREIIDEPKTPYERGDASMEMDDKTLDFTKLNEKIKEMDITEPMAVKKAKEAEFEARRKEHYNEFTKVKEFLKTHPLDEEEDEDQS